MYNEMYEVSRDEYTGVVGQINPAYTNIEINHEDEYTIIRIVRKNGTELTARIIPNEGEERYYVINLPSKEESLPLKPVQKFVLETKEEVQAFFDILNKLQHKEKEDD